MKSSGHRLYLWSGVALLYVSGVLAEPAPNLALPLHTQGDQIVDRSNHPVQLLSVNWYGFDQKEVVVGGLDHATIHEIADEIVGMGFNSVRLQWANETVERNPVVAASTISANPSLVGQHSMDVMDLVIAALTARHLMVILDNHMSNADWCCNDNDGDALWYSDEYSEVQWIADWQSMARRYANNRWVIGADLRNEPRGKATWGGADSRTDWRAAALRGGNAVLAANPNLLIFVEGPNYSNTFTEVARNPITLCVADRLVISPHSYSIGETYKSYEEAAAVLHHEFDPLLKANPRLPLWVGEFGHCTSGKCAEYGAEWLGWLARFCNENGIHNVAWWALNATQSSGRGRVYGAPEDYGLLSLDWKGVRSRGVVGIIHSIRPGTARPDR